MRQPLFLGLFLCSALYTSEIRCEERNGSPSPIWVASANFVVRSYRGGPSAPTVLHEAQQLRRRCADYWLGRVDPTTWNPRCELVVHPTKASYLQAVGRAAAQTSGSSLIQSSGGRIVQRRIDLLADDRGEFPALAHELTHIVLADRFAGRQPPRWLDEGIALLADPAKKQSLHERDCREAIDTGTALRLAELLTLDRFTSSHQVAPFYGQSRSLVQFFAERGEPAAVVEFAETALDYGYDRALSQHYAIGDVADLERHWRVYAAKRRGTSPVVMHPVSQTRRPAR